MSFFASSGADCDCTTTKRPLSIFGRGGVTTVLMVAVGALWVGKSLGQVDRAPDVVRASKFELVDTDGHVRAEIAIDKDGSAGFFVRDRQGRLRASLTHDDDASALYLWDDAGATRVGAALFAHGGAGVAVHGPETKGAAVLYYKNGGSITVYDAEGKTVARMPEPVGTKP